MKKFALASHVKCYLADPSICKLPKEDQLSILGAIDLSEVITDRGSRDQFIAVFKACLSQSEDLTDDVVQLMRVAIDKLSQQWTSEHWTL